MAEIGNGENNKETGPFDGFEFDGTNETLDRELSDSELNNLTEEELTELLWVRLKYLHMIRAMNTGPKKVKKDDPSVVEFMRYAGRAFSVRHHKFGTKDYPGVGRIVSREVLETLEKNELDKLVHDVMIFAYIIMWWDEEGVIYNNSDIPEYNYLGNLLKYERLITAVIKEKFDEES